MITFCLWIYRDLFFWLFNWADLSCFFFLRFLVGLAVADYIYAEWKIYSATESVLNSSYLKWLRVPTKIVINISTEYRTIHGHPKCRLSHRWSLLPVGLQSQRLRSDTRGIRHMYRVRIHSEWLLVRPQAEFDTRPSFVFRVLVYVFNMFGLRHKVLCEPPCRWSS